MACQNLDWACRMAIETREGEDCLREIGTDNKSDRIELDILEREVARLETARIDHKRKEEARKREEEARKRAEEARQREEEARVQAEEEQLEEQLEANRQREAGVNIIYS